MSEKDFLERKIKYFHSREGIKSGGMVVSSYVREKDTVYFDISTGRDIVNDFAARAAASKYCGIVSFKYFNAYNDLVNRSAIEKAVEALFEMIDKNKKYKR